MLFRTRPNRPELDATKVPTGVDIAWAAGVYEGEGNIRLCGRGKRSLAATVVQKDPEILYRLRDWFGGSVNSPCGVNPCFRWDICGDRARLFIAQIHCFLSARRKVQVESANALDFLQGKSPDGMGVDSLKSQMLTFYSEHFDTTWRSPVFRKTQMMKKYYRDRQRKIRGTKPEDFKVVSIA